jgi:hypothetical protein
VRPSAFCRRTFRDDRTARNDESGGHILHPAA